MLDKIAKIIATVFYIGKIPYAPGTFGSIAAFPFLYAIILLLAKNYTFFNFIDVNYEVLINLVITIGLLVTTVLLFIIGTIATHIYLRNADSKDPKEVVIDELVGQVITLIGCSFSRSIININDLSSFILLITFQFLLFRFFDIVKPWPINWVDEKIPGALGVMLDDVLAAIFAIVTNYVIIFIISDYL